MVTLGEKGYNISQALILLEGNSMRLGGWGARTELLTTL